MTQTDASKSKETGTLKVAKLLLSADIWTSAITDFQKIQQAPREITAPIASPRKA